VSGTRKASSLPLPWKSEAEHAAAFQREQGKRRHDLERVGPEQAGVQACAGGRVGDVENGVLGD
jgi:hypothetical protein